MLKAFPRALEPDGDGERLYRGKRGTGRAPKAYSWWTPNQQYAETYGNHVITGTLKLHANILDLRTLTDNDGWISGQDIGELVPELPRAMGLYTDDEVLLWELWEHVDGSMTKASMVLLENGYDGFVWVEGAEMNDAYLLVQ